MAAPSQETLNKILFLFLTNGKYDRVREYLEKGADPNTAQGERLITPLMRACEINRADIVGLLLDSGANVHARSIDEETALHYARTRDCIEPIYARGADVNAQDRDRRTPLHYAALHGNLEHIQALLEFHAREDPIDINGETPLTLLSRRDGELEDNRPAARALLDAGANVNHMNNNGETPLFIAASLGNRRLVQLFLDRVDLDRGTDFHQHTILEHAQAGVRFSPAINALIIQRLGGVQAEMWRGWTQSDVVRFDDVFQEGNENEVSCCPVCLKIANRGGGCMYVHHNCRATGGYYHRALYDRYKNANGDIEWCTICNRIADTRENHFELGLAQDDRPEVIPHGDFFDDDCRTTNGGGGPPEKILRFMRLRDRALAAQADVGVRTEQEVLDGLVEAVWNAPLTATNENRQRVENILFNREFNVPTRNFPAAAAAPAPNAAPAVPLANVLRPPNNAENPDLQPILHPHGNNAVELEEKDDVIQFRHRMENGEINNHQDNYISKETLIKELRRRVLGFRGDNFGRCWDFPTCTAMLYPEEIREFVPEDLYQEYKQKFNLRFQPAQGGGRRRQRGGYVGSIFAEAVDAVCYVPKKTTQKTRKGGRRRRRATRRKNYRKRR